MLLDIGAERVSDIPVNPLPTVPATNMERLAAEWDNQRLTYGTGSGARALYEAYEPQRQLLRSLGFDAPNPVDADATALGGIFRSTAGRDVVAQEYAAIVAKARQQHPDRAAELLMPDEVQKKADDLARAARTTAENMERVGGGGAGALAAQIGAAVIDPVNVLTMPLGAGAIAGGAARRILLGALAEGAVGAGAQIAVDLNPFGQGGALERRRLGLDMELGAGVVGGFLGGAILGGGTRALVEGVRAFRSRVPAPDGGVALGEADAMAVLDRSSRDVASSPGGARMAEQHLELTTRATDAVAAGRIAPDDVRAYAPRAEIAGEQVRIHTPAGRSIAAEPQVVELRDLIPSHTDDMALNPAYPHGEGVQPRDRSRDASVAQIRDIAGNLEPERLRTSPEAGNGAPIVDGENVVESGNGRVLALRQVYGDPALVEKAASYRAMLEAQGLDVSGFQQPVLVSRRVTALDPEARRSFVREANSTTALTMGAAERARLDADLAGRALDLYQGGDVTLAQNAPFVRAFMQGVPAAERGALVAADGTLSGEGARRVRGAVLARAYGDEMGPLLDRILEGEAEGLRSIAGALQDTAPRWAAMRLASERGEIAPGLDVTADLLAAVRTVSLSREKRIPVADLLAQTDLDAPPLTDQSRALLASMYRDPGYRNAAGRETLAGRLAGYLDEAMQTRPEPDLFGAPPPMANDIFQAIAARETGRSSAPMKAPIWTPEFMAAYPRLQSPMAEMAQNLMPGHQIEFRAGIPSDVNGKATATMVRGGAGEPDFIITLRPDLPPAQAAHAITHEIGHAFQAARFDVAPEATQVAIARQWAAEVGADTDPRAVYRLGLADAARNGDDSLFQRIAAGFKGDEAGLSAKPQHVEYANQFREWFAEKFAEWAVTERGPRTVLERFFAGVTDLVRQAYDRANAALGIKRPRSAFEDFASQAWRPPASTIDNATDPMRGRQQALVQQAEAATVLREAPGVDDATFLEAQRIAAARDVQIPVDDAGNTRGLRELLDEAEDAVADAAAAAGCLIGGAGALL